MYELMYAGNESNVRYLGSDLYIVYRTVSWPPSLDFFIQSMIDHRFGKFEA